MPEFKTFRIDHSFTVPGGKRYTRTGAYQAQSKPEEDLLALAQFAIPIDPGAAPPPPPPAPKPEEPPQPEDPDKPDWSFMTKSAMRAWLDQAGIVLPPKSATHGKYVELCEAAWETGARPNPLYGFPGGPEPAPGLPGPDATDPVALSRAIDACEESGTQVPQESMDALMRLTSSAQREPDAEAREHSQDAREATNEPAPEAFSPDATGASDSTNDPQPSPGSATGKCEGCPSEATTEDAHGTPLCQECYDGLANDADRPE